jgi:hypothetical protein
MVFGHNTNVKIGGVTFHVQTEDRGDSNALIDTTVYHQGRVLHRRTNNYFDLLPMNEDCQQALKLRLDEQHQNVLDEIQSGALQLSIPQPAMVKTPAPVVAILVPALVAQRRLLVDLLNAKSWLSGRHATLQVLIKEENGDPVPHARIEVEIEGSAEQQIQDGTSGMNGKSQIEFDMPKITGAEPAIVIRAEENQAKGQLRFALRAKPKVPAL